MSDRKLDAEKARKAISEILAEFDIKLGEATDAEGAAIKAYLKGVDAERERIAKAIDDRAEESEGVMRNDDTFHVQKRLVKLLRNNEL